MFHFWEGVGKLTLTGCLSFPEAKIDNVLHQLPALELRLNLAEDTALNLQEKSVANCGLTECAGSAVFAV
jgi:hypothetical protein